MRPLTKDEAEERLKLAIDVREEIAEMTLAELCSPEFLKAKDELNRAVEELDAILFHTAGHA